MLIVLISVILFVILMAGIALGVGRGSSPISHESPTVTPKILQTILSSTDEE